MFLSQLCKKINFFGPFFRNLIKTTLCFFKQITFKVNRLSFDQKKKQLKTPLKEFSERINLGKDIPPRVVIYHRRSFYKVFIFYSCINQSDLYSNFCSNESIRVVSHLFSFSLSSSFLPHAVDVQRKNHKFNQAPDYIK